MWDGTKERKEGNGISTPSFPAVERNQREGNQDERGDMAKQPEKALATAKTRTWLKHLFPEGIQPRAEDPEGWRDPPRLLSWL